MTICQ